MVEFDLFIDAPGDGARWLIRALTTKGVAEAAAVSPTGADEFNELRVRVASEEIGVELREQFGKLLFDSLFAGDVLMLWGRISGEEVRLRLHIDEPSLAELPWELLYDGANFPATHKQYAVARYIMRLEPPEPPFLDKLRILFFTAAPAGLPAINEAEVEELRDTIAASGGVEVDTLRNATAKLLAQRLRARDYHVLHYLGHGQPGGLLLEPDGDDGVLSDRGLGQMVFGYPSLRLVVLSACSSAVRQQGATSIFAGAGPALIRCGVPAAIAMQYQFVQLSTAKTFNRVFYEEVGRGTPADVAVNRARNEISAGKLIDQRDWSTPVLYLGTRNSRLMKLKSNETAAVDEAVNELQKAAAASVESREAWQLIRTEVTAVQSRVTVVSALWRLDSVLDRMRSAAQPLESVSLPQQVFPQAAALRSVLDKWRDDIVPGLRAFVARNELPALADRLTSLAQGEPVLRTALDQNNFGDFITKKDPLLQTLRNVSAEVDGQIDDAVRQLQAASDRTLARLA